MTDRAIEVLDKADSVRAVSADKNLLHVIVDNSSDVEAKILSALVQAGVPVVSFLREEENFEAFIKRKTGGDV